MKARVTLSVGGLMVASAVLNWLMVEAVAPGMGGRTLMVGLATGVAVTLLTLWIAARQDAGIKRIADGLSDVARGRKDLRFDVDREPLVRHLAIAANEAIGSLADAQDPSVGQVRVRKRGETDPRMRLNDSVLEDPTVGAPRAVPRREEPAPPPQSSSVRPLSSEVSIPSNSARVAPLPPDASVSSSSGRLAPLAPMPAEGPPVAAPAETSTAPTQPPSNASQPPPVSTPAPATSGNASQPPVIAMAPPASASLPADVNLTPSKTPIPLDATSRQAHFHSVFQEYVASLGRVGERTDDLTFDGFQETLAATEKQLMDKHGCKGVKFSVLVEGGKVQLLPRLVR
ncbi:MAG: MXAN_5187 C-terminal domain-containing protein [Myxococcota bacterium]